MFYGRPTCPTYHSRGARLSGEYLADSWGPETRTGWRRLMTPLDDRRGMMDGVGDAWSR
jgi:hypothetical protein